MSGRKGKLGHKNMISWFKTYVLSLRRDFVWLLAIDVVFLLVMEVGLRNIPAPCAIFVRIGDLFVTLGVSFLASFIFYFVQVHMHKIKEKENVYPSIAQMFRFIINAEWDILSNLLGVKKGDISEEIIREKVQEINLYTEAPLVIGRPDGDHKANWIEYCIYYVKTIDRNGDMMMNMSAYLDSECMNLLLRIQNSDTFLINVRRLFPMCNGNPHFINYKVPTIFINFWHFIEEQEAYYDREFNSYFNKHLVVIN